MIEIVNIKDIEGEQFIKIPTNFKLKGDKVYFKKFGNAFYIIPFDDPWQSLLDSMGKFSDDFMENRNQPNI
ncbi:AbrB/MazE/SpoVT family DNA-binding domain-containing protein [Marivirga tractuosa]